MRKPIYVVACALFFAGGAYVWKIKNTGMTLAAHDAPAPVKTSDLASGAVVVEVGGERITADDINWEYNLLTEGVFDKNQLTPIPDLGDRYHQELATLRRTLLSNVIERKLLFQFVKQDHDFVFDDPKRYSGCLTEWQQSMQGNSSVLQVKGGKDRLKSRLCERSILDQYLHERLFAKVEVSDGEVLEYYKNHAAEYRLGERVQIRQVLLGDEASAKRWRAQINPHNFAQIAGDHSLAPEAAKGGLLGPFAKGAMPAVFDVAFHMHKGEISEVMKSNYGYHIIMVVEKLPRVDESLAEAKAKITSTLRKKKQEDEYGKLVEKALAAINVSLPRSTW